VVDTNLVAGVRSGRYWGIQTTNAFDLSTFATNPAACNTTTCQIISQGTLPIGVSFGNGYGSALPAPMAGVALATASKCSFCVGTPSGWGSILFSPGGSPTFSAAPTGTGQQFTLHGTRDTATNRPRIKTVAVISRNGLIEAFEKN
jgi:hypothetical protein